MIDDKLINGEQPENLNVQTVATDGEKGTEKSDYGSPLGKFKDLDSLLNAYNELQSEFTRKCQRLSETEKKLQEVNGVSSSGAEENTVAKNEFAWKENIGEFSRLCENFILSKDKELSSVDSSLWWYMDKNNLIAIFAKVTA